MDTTIEPEQAVRQRVHEMWDAYAARDLPRFTSCLDPEISFIGTGADEHATSIDDLRAYFERELEQVPDPYRIAIVTERVTVSGTVAWAECFLRLTLTLDGRLVQPPPVRATVVLRYDGETWRIVQSHASFAAADQAEGEAYPIQALWLQKQELEALLQERTGQLEARVEELAVINSVQQGLVAALEMQAIYDLVGERLRGLFDAQAVVIRTYDLEAGMQHFRYAIEKGERLYVPPFPIDGFHRHMIASREPILVEEGFVDVMARYGGRMVAAGEAPKSGVYVPMIVGDRVWGNVSLQNVDREYAFTEADMRLLITLTNSMSVALESARLFEETNRRATELDTVNRISRALVSQLEFDALVRLVGEQVRETFAADIVFVALHDREADMIRFVYEHGDKNEDRPFGDGLTERIITSRVPLLVNTSLEEVRERLGAQQIGKVATSFLGVPILVGDEAAGVISVQSTEHENRFDADDLRLLTTIAGNVGVAFQNAQAYRRLAATIGQLNDTLGALKAMQQQLVQQEKLASLGALTAGIAHEIKNPLNFVNNFAQLSEELVNEIEHERSAKPDLRVEEVDDLLSDLKRNAARIREHGQRADSIVRNMLAHSRGNSGVREAVDVNALLDEYTSLAFHGMRAQRPDFTCSVERDFDASVGSVQAVPQDLSRVFLNLLSNAFYAVARRRDEAAEGYTPTVRVATRRSGDAVEASVWDNGGGIPETVRAKIFEPFFTTKPTGEGTGLGLSLSHDIVAAHGGQLLLTTEEGAWTQFTVRLPSTPA